MKISLSINPKEETKRIVNFLISVRKKTKKDKVVIGLSGGIDSTTVFYLLKKAYKSENIIGVSLPYEKIKPIADKLIRFGGTNFYHTRVSPLRGPLGSEKIVTSSSSKVANPANNIRLGNIIARIRMIVLFDLAKKYDALVCGTENKSERLLGYFTRFGDAASDIEPISHLYKTQVRELANYLKVPQKIIDVAPTAGLWQGQTDEKELGFTYKEADQVLYLYYDKKMPVEKIPFKNSRKIIKRVLNNQFKQEVPYLLSSD
jgi:NAD+ synthase